MARDSFCLKKKHVYIKNIKEQPLGDCAVYSPSTINIKSWTVQFGSLLRAQQLNKRIGHCQAPLAFGGCIERMTYDHGA